MGQRAAAAGVEGAGELTAALLEPPAPGVGTVSSWWLFTGRATTFSSQGPSVPSPGFT